MVGCSIRTQLRAAKMRKKDAQTRGTDTHTHQQKMFVQPIRLRARITLKIQKFNEYNINKKNTREMAARLVKTP